MEETASFAVKSGDIEFVTLLTIVLISALIITTIINILSYYVALAALKFRLDPDDHCIPITSSLMDVISTVVLMAVMSFFI